MLTRFEKIEINGRTFDLLACAVQRTEGYSSTDPVAVDAIIRTPAGAASSLGGLVTGRLLLPEGASGWDVLLPRMQVAELTRVDEAATIYRLRLVRIWT